ncbi:MAG TPA: SLC13 family permease [Acidobacteriota bacterium]|jgi:Na+/H+ antiporter NhaD/arsenite permease-like protein
MNLAEISLAALVLAIVLSCTTRLNVGFVALVLAWIVGVYFGRLSLAEVAAGFPTRLFLTLTGVTLLFTQARVNGTLERIAAQAVRCCRGNSGLIPIAFFLMAVTVASVGAGNIASAAIVSPMAMAVASQAGISPFLMTIMVGNGANAGSLSPFAPTGVIVTGLMARIGLTGVEWQTYLFNLVAHTLVAFAGYFAFGGVKLFRRRQPDDENFPGRNKDETGTHETLPPQKFEARHWVTLAILGTLIAVVVAFEVDIGMAAFSGAVLLAFLRMGDESAAIRQIPWNVIMMVSGMTLLVALLEKTGGMGLFTSLLATISTQHSVTFVIALLTGLISVYSSTSGVVLPAFLPTVPGLIAKLGGGDPLAIASSINVGGHLVDVSPLSTIGALCIASALTTGEETRVLFNKVLAWGLSMSVVGALLCYLFFGLLWQA